MKLSNTLKAILVFAIATLFMNKTAVAQCTVANPIYVASGGTGPGTAVSPANFTSGVQLFQQDTTRAIFMAAGNYDFYNTLTLPSGIQIEGSFNVSNGVWSKSAIVNTNININNPFLYRDTVIDYGDTFHVLSAIGIKLKNVNNIVLKDFNVNVSRASPIYSDRGDGWSIYGIHIAYANNVQLYNLGITTADAENGRDGLPGADGINAYMGQGGGLTVDNSLTTNVYEPVYALLPGQSPITVGGAGGAGGSVQEYTQCSGIINCVDNPCQLQDPAPVGGAGGSGSRTNGGAGGACGQPCDISCWLAEYENSLSSDPATFLSDLMNGILPPPVPISQSGIPGANGSSGISGDSAGTFSAVPRPDEGYMFFAPGPGAGGGSGSGGSGGGGGGAGGIDALVISGGVSSITGLITADSYYGVFKKSITTVEYAANLAGHSVCGAQVLNFSSRGGSGGGGGQGGGGGNGGGGGGGNFGIYYYQSSNIVPADITYHLGAAGIGGSGGQGGRGAMGAQGVPGPAPVTTNVVFPSFQGATGGNGGNGGNGGRGQNGSNGKQYTAFGFFGSPYTLIYNIDTAHACQNSVIGVSFSQYERIVVSPLINGGGAPLAPVVSGPTYNQYVVSGAATDLLVQVTNTYLPAVYGNYYIHLRPRALPSFTIRHTICETDSLLLTPDAGSLGQEGYSWKVYADSTLVAQSSTASWTFNPTNKSSNILYRVEFSAYSACCGWSAPAINTFRVEDSLTAMAITYGTTFNSTVPPYCAGSYQTQLQGVNLPGLYNSSNGTYTYPGIRWNTGDSNTNNIYTGINGNYSYTYTSAAGCLSHSATFALSGIQTLPTGSPTPVSDTTYGCLSYTTITPHDANYHWYNFYATNNPNDVTPLPGGANVQSFTYYPYFNLAQLAQDSVVIYMKYLGGALGCPSAQKSPVVIHRYKTPPSLVQPFTNNYYVNVTSADARCSGHLNYQEPVGYSCGQLAYTTRVSGPGPGGDLPLGWDTITYKMVNQFFDSTMVYIYIHVQDEDAPSFTSFPPSVYTVHTSPGVCTGILNITPPTASDNCSGAVLPVHDPGILGNDTTWSIGTSYRYYNYTDIHNLNTNWIAQVNVVDNQPPVLTCPADQVWYISPGDSGKYVSYLPAIATDNCPLAGPNQPRLTSGFNAENTWRLHPPGATLQVYSDTDAAGNVGTCSFTIDVRDTLKPGITCRDSSGFTLTTNYYTTINYPTPIAIAPYGPVTVHLLSGKRQGDTATVGYFTAIWQATDQYGNTSTCPVHISVVDTAAPHIVCPGDIVVPNDPGLCTATVNYTVAPALDIDGHYYNPTLYSGLASGSAFPIGTTNVTYSVVNASNSGAGCSFKVIVKDTIKPVFTSACPHDTTINIITAACGAVLAAPVLTGTSHDFVPPSIGIWRGSASGVFPYGTTTQEYRIIDGHGNYNICSYNVSVVDTNTLRVRCPLNVTRNNDPGSCYAIIPDFGGQPVLTPTYGCANIAFSTHQSDTFYIGTNYLTYNVSVDGKLAGCSYTVTVVNTNKPSIASPANIVTTITPGTCGKVVNFTAPVGTDACLNGVYTNIATGLAPGSTFPIGSTQETYIVADLAGNRDTARFTITVLDTVKPTITAQADIYDSTNSMCGKVINFTTPVGADNSSCFTVTLMQGLPAGSLFPVGNTKEVYLVADNGGNTDSVVFTVHVDPIRPLVSNCMSDWLQTDLTGNGIIVYYPVPGTVDQYTGQMNACAGVSVQLVSGQGSGAFFSPGPHLETYRFIVQGTGDTVLCSTNVIVTETTPPTIICGNISTYTIPPVPGTCSAPFTIPVPQTSDNGGPVTLTHTIDNSLVSDTNAIDTFSAGFHRINYTARDYSGNVAQCTLYVNVASNASIGNTFSNTTYCQNSTVDISPMIHGSTAGLTYAWLTTDSLGNYYIYSADSVLHFDALQPSDQRQYSLRITQACGNTLHGNDFFLRVTAAPATTLSGLSAGYCVGDVSNVPLTGTPAGGTISGHGVTGNIFNPALAGLGQHVITYAYTDPVSGCTGISNVTVVVSDPPVDSLFADSVYCINTSTIQLSPANSVYSGAGISGTTFSPAAAGSGYHALTRTVTVNGCASHLTQNVRVNTVLPNATITAPAIVCESSTDYVITAATPGGFWRGTYITIDSPTGHAIFNPGNAGPGTDSVFYSVTRSGCTSTASAVITVLSNAYNLPYTFPQFCTTSAPVLFDTTDGKNYLGLGFYNNVFYPDSAGPRGIKLYFAVTTNSAGCKDTIARLINLQGGQLDVATLQGICTTHDSVYINLDNRYDSIVWSNGSTANAQWFRDTGTYQVFLRDTQGCYGFDTLRIRLYHTPSPIVSAVPIYTCVGDSAVLLASDSIITFTRYTWSNGDTTPSIKVLPGSYTVSVTTNNGCRYTSAPVAVIASVDTIRPVITCAHDTVLYAPGGSCSVTGVSLVPPVASDNCNLASVTSNAPLVYNVGITPVSWTARDVSNNIKTCVQRVTVSDTTKPYFTTVPLYPVVMDTVSNNCTGTIPDFVALFAASDSCSTVTLTQSPAVGTFTTTQYTSVGITARDAAGNTTTYYMIYQTEDTIMPVVTCPQNIAATISGSTTTAIVHYVAPTQASNCPNSTVRLVAGLSSGSAFPIGITTQKFVVTDAGGATDTCSFTVTVTHLTGIAPNSGADDFFTVMPVPTTDHVTIMYQNSAASVLHVKLMSITGQIVFSEDVTPFSGTYNRNLDLAKQAAGTYILEITSDNETATRKIVKM